MMKPYYDYQGLDLLDSHYFCDTVLEKGTIVSLSKTESCVSKYTPRSIAWGVSLCDVVNKDLTKFHINTYADEVQQYGKIRLIRKGQIIVHIPEEIVVGQKIYIHPDRAGFTKKRLRFCKQVGIAIGNSDEKGFVRIEIDFTRR